MGSPEACTECGVDLSEQDLSEERREYTDDDNIVFIYECPECCEPVTSMVEWPHTEPDDHTLMLYVIEDEVQSLTHIHAGEDSASVKMKRAEFNMRGGDLYEVHGRVWAIERVFDLLCDHLDLPDEYTGVVELPGDEFPPSTD